MTQVHVTEGILEGELINNEYGGSYYSFKGIPYAAPPLGDLRFKAPQPVTPWQGIRSAKEFGSDCYQFAYLPTFVIYGAEDCLYLNVYTPEIKPASPLPVMVWIHGGGFTSGSGVDDLYGPQFLVRHDIILVTFNYRLEALGFLCLDTEDIPGNAGMKDQVAALRWVKKNISNFGGDPENITIFGESAGGVSVTYHLVSPMTKGLFKRAIAQSGTCTNFWAHGFEPREKALLLARQLGCYSEDDKELYNFFKNQPIEKLVALNLPVTRAQKPYEMHFGIVSEKTFGENEVFFSGDEIDALRNNIHDVDIMTGYNQDECLLIFIKETIEGLCDMGNNFTELFVPKTIQNLLPIKQQLESARKIKKFYFGDVKLTRENSEQLFKFLSLEFFVHGIMLFSKLSAKAKKNVYLYKFSCMSERNIILKILGLDKVLGDKPYVCHADDIAYLFPFKVANLKVDQESQTFKLINRMTTMWTNFAKYGKPTPDESLGVTWPLYNLDKQEYLSIGNDLATGTAPDADQIDFWDSIFKEYIPSWSV